MSQFKNIKTLISVLKNLPHKVGYKWKSFVTANSAKIKDSEMDSILYSSLFTIGLTILTYSVEILPFNTELLFDQNSSWLKVAFLLFLSTVFCIAILICLDRKNVYPTRLWLYPLSLLYLSLVFCCVNASGGLTASPFISFYPAILAVGIIISERPPKKFFVIRICKIEINTPRFLAFLVVMILLFISGHLLFQYKGYTGQITQNQKQALEEHTKEEVPTDPNQKRHLLKNENSQIHGITYFIKYACVIAIALIATGVADYKSLNQTASNETSTDT